MSTPNADDFLEHYGKKGMKWGRRAATSTGIALANKNVGASHVAPDGKIIKIGKRVQDKVDKQSAKLEATRNALATGVADKKVLSRREVRGINKAAERDFYQNKMNRIHAEAFMGDDVIIATRLPTDHAVTLAGGKEILNHMRSGGVLDAKYTEVMYRRDADTGAYVENTKLIGNYQNIRRA